jgi:N4-gp56 family major capsid protein
MSIAAPGSLLVSPVEEAEIAKLTQVGAVSNGLPTGSDGVDSLITRAYELLAHQNYRRELLFDEAATVRLARVSHNGAVYQLNVVDDISDDPSTALLVEQYDVLPTPLVSWKLDVILKEYGRVVTTTNLLRGTSFVPVDPIAAERIGRNAGATMDRLALSVLLGSGGITKAGAAGSAPTDVTVTGKPSDTLRAAAQSFADNNVMPFASGYYRAYINPAGITALRSESDAAGWRYNAVRNASDEVRSGMNRRYVTTYEGFEIYSTTTPGIATPGGVFLGADALAKVAPQAAGFGTSPEIVIAPVVDRLRRFASVGWKWLGAYSRFRSEAVLTGDLAET